MRYSMYVPFRRNSPKQHSISMEARDQHFLSSCTQRVYFLKAAHKPSFYSSQYVRPPETFVLACRRFDHDSHHRSSACRGNHTIHGEPRGIPRHCRHTWQGSVELNRDGPDYITILIEVQQNDRSCLRINVQDYWYEVFQDTSRKYTVVNQLGPDGLRQKYLGDGPQGCSPSPEPRLAWRLPGNPWFSPRLQLRAKEWAL
ncbi:hypothetical protein B0H13DRAFT_160617 [Mycena leptocephala]|nr:hypothetical protein B0H13DRAFT_160617 [Mycena leptocephala]